METLDLSEVLGRIQRMKDKRREGASETRRHQEVCFDQRSACGSPASRWRSSRRWLDDWMKATDVAVSAVQCWTSIEENLGAAGASIVEVDLPHTSYGIPTYYIVATARPPAISPATTACSLPATAVPPPTDLIDPLLPLARPGVRRLRSSEGSCWGPTPSRRGYERPPITSSALKVRRLIKRNFDLAFEEV